MRDLFLSIGGKHDDVVASFERKKAEGLVEALNEIINFQEKHLMMNMSKASYFKQCAEEALAQYRKGK